MKKLNVGNPFFDFMGALGDWLLLNVLFVLTCIPVVTIGTASTAVYHVAFKLLDGQSGYVIREYVNACRQKWKRSTAVWLILALAGGILTFDVLYAGNVWSYLYIVIGCMLLIWCFVSAYVFALLARFDSTVNQTLKHALYLSVRHLPYTIVIVILNLIPVICVLLGSFTAAMAVPIYCAFGFALTARINGALLKKIFNCYVPEAVERE